MGKTVSDKKGYEKAAALALSIEEHWHSRGFTDVRAWVSDEIIRTDGKYLHRVYGVRTNLKQGLPPSAPLLKKAA
jgi:hypothetical protein